MGAFLDKPKTEKTGESGEGYGIKYAVSAMQGWRLEMEDAHVCKTESPMKNWSFFAVFDGHAGAGAAKYCSTNLVDSILEALKELKKKGENSKDSEEDLMVKAIKEGFISLDKAMSEDGTWSEGLDHSGTTALVVLISPTHIYWANCGDSRGFICRSNTVPFHTADHKPYVVSEKERIEKAGGTVMMQRVNGSLAVSRALGDFDYKRNASLSPIEQLVSPEPDITVISRDNSEDEFLFMACDGIYDVMSNEEVKSFIRSRLELTADLQKICQELIDYCLHKNSRDNMSVILVTFPNSPKVSEEAICKKKKLDDEAKEKIEEKLKELVGAADDSLELQESSVIQNLSAELPENYEVAAKRPWISEYLQELVKERFGTDNEINDSEQDYFTGPSDPSSAPPEFGEEMIIDPNLMAMNNTNFEDDEKSPGSIDVEQMETTEEGSKKTNDEDGTQEQTPTEVAT